MLQVGKHCHKLTTYQLQDSDVGKTLAHADRSRKVTPSDVGLFVVCETVEEGREVWDYCPATTTRGMLYAHH